ncbi:hypothetical protein M407DRAFT_163684 [Tulasnella calospora MUT 4182]|uniref:Retrotransposon gag domain-containing protein n=1 Tax=Tulasnella calospora MUT 4182 TaxID=1051891 RepID=A0A0C3QET3_9AGAM|nr:hypothetical protein M407DRAFT_163684 [Tulasnella calospora MUT 4182]
MSTFSAREIPLPQSPASSARTLASSALTLVSNASSSTVVSSALKLDPLPVDFLPFVIFRGEEDGHNVEDFILSIRQRAFSLDKQMDYAWTAQYASTCIAGEALRWYESLDQEIQGDWGLLRKALLERYPPQKSPIDTIDFNRLSALDSPITPHICMPLPTPAAPEAPVTSPVPPVVRSRSPFRTEGYLRIISPIPSADGYVSRTLGPNGTTFCHTPSKESAMKVSYESSDPKLLRILNYTNPQYQWLGITLHVPKLKYNSQDPRHGRIRASLTAVSGRQLGSVVSSWPERTSHTKVEVWDIEPDDGSVVGSRGSGPLTAMINIEDGRICLFSDFKTFKKHYVLSRAEGYRNARLTIEPIS